MTGRRGFTVVELVVALLVSAVVVLLTAQIFAVTGDAAREIQETHRTLDRESNAHRWLAAALLDLDVGSEGTVPFDGQPDHLAFSSWLPTADGWSERRTVRLELRGAQLVATTEDGAVPLADSVAALGLDYLLVPGADTRWAPAWTSPVSAPLAIRVRLVRMTADANGVGRADTMLYLVKARG